MTHDVIGMTHDVISVGDQTRVGDAWRQSNAWDVLSLGGDGARDGRPPDTRLGPAPRGRRCRCHLTDYLTDYLILIDYLTWVYGTPRH